MICNSRSIVALIVGSVLSVTAAAAATPAVIQTGDRVVFLGDSITDAGHYIGLVEAHLRLDHKLATVDWINLGLPSETCSGLSEPAHPFPRPDVHERLDRVLAKANPDVVVACYGMNDGIYHPFSSERFKAYQDGIRRLIQKVQASDARLVLLTPPAFDPLPMKKQGKLVADGEKKYAWFAIYAGYDEVMQQYAQWVLQQDQRVAKIVDLHAPVNTYLARKRALNPDFVMSDDGVHVNVEGHAVIAKALVESMGMQWRGQLDKRLVEWIYERQQLLHRAWLSHVGHQRPGVKAGLPLDEAKLQAARIERKITGRVSELQGPSPKQGERLGPP